MEKAGTTMYSLDDLKYFLTTYKSIQSHAQHFNVPNLDPTAQPSLPCVRVVVCGDVSSGKSTFINALLGKDILPSSEAKCTSRITIITKSRDNTPRLVLLHPDGETVAQEHPLTEKDQDETRRLLNDMAAAQDAKSRETHLQTAQIVRWEFVGNPLLDAGLELVDTPGMNESANVLQKVSEILRESVLVFYLLPVTAGCVTMEHTAALQRLKESSCHGVTPMVIITKVDDEIPKRRSKTQADKDAYAEERRTLLADMKKEVQIILPELRDSKLEYFHAVSAEDALSSLEENQGYPDPMQKLIHSIVPVVSTQLRVTAKACLQLRIDSVFSTMEIHRTSVHNATMAGEILKNIQQLIPTIRLVDELKVELLKAYDQSIQRMKTFGEALLKCKIPAYDPNHPKGLTLQQQAVQYISSLIEREIAVSMNEALHQVQKGWCDSLFRALEKPLKSLGMPCWVAGRKDHSFSSTAISQNMTKVVFWHKLLTWLGLGTELIQVQVQENLTMEGRIRILQAILSHYRDNTTKERIVNECMNVGEQTFQELEKAVNILLAKVNRRAQGQDTESLPPSVVEAASKVVPQFYSLLNFPEEPVITEGCEIVAWNHWGTVHKARWEGNDCYAQLIHVNQHKPVLRYLVHLEHYLSVVVLKNQPDVVAVLMSEPPRTFDPVVDSLVSPQGVDRTIIGILNDVPLAKTPEELRDAVHAILADDTLTDQHMSDIDDFYFVHGARIKSNVPLTSPRGDDVLFDLKVLGLYTLENPIKSLHAALNSMLCGANRTTEIRDHRRGVYLATVLTNLRKYCRKVSGTKTLYRGLNCVPNLLDATLSKQGNFHSYTFTSAVANIETAKERAREGAMQGSKMTIFHIEAMDAYEIGFLSVTRKEEWIMVPGAHFECMQDPDVTSDPDFVHVYLKQIGTDVYLLF